MNEFGTPKLIRQMHPENYWWADEWVDGHYWRYYYDNAGKFLAKKHLLRCPFDAIGA